MKKSEQLEINKKIEDAYKSSVHYGYFGDRPNFNQYYREKRLRNCSATVITTDYGYYLKSYSTIIAFIPRGSDICYDFLRLVYGYTTTSAQHISKFCRDYGVITKLTWKEV